MDDNHVQSSSSHAAHQLSEPGCFTFSSSPDGSSSTPASPVTAAASGKSIGNFTASPPLLSLDGLILPELRTQESSLDRSRTPKPTLLEAAIERNSTPRPALPTAAPPLHRWGSHDSAASTGDEADRSASESAGGSTSGGSAFSSFRHSSSIADDEATPSRVRRLVEPPTPLALPGGWTARAPRGASRQRPEMNSDERAAHDLRWRLIRKSHHDDISRPFGEDSDSDGHADEALVLPPPFLTTDSPRESFDGLLGVRTTRQRSRLARQHERLFAQGRAPPPPFPQNVVRAAVKVARLLGPPGGFDENGRRIGAAEAAQRRRARSEVEKRDARRHGKSRGLSLDQAAQIVEQEDTVGRQIERQRRRVKRAESGIKLYELGAKVGRHVAGRLERHRSQQHVIVSPLQSGGVAQALRPRMTPAGSFGAVSPADLLGTPPTPESLPSASLEQPDLPPLSDGDELLESPPSAPALRPTSLADPLPTVSTPFFLEDAALAPDYFGMRHRSTTSSRRGSLPVADVGKTALNGDFAAATRHISERPFALKAHPSRFSKTRHIAIDWVIWILIGSPPDPTSAGLDTSIAFVGGLLGIAIHLVAFTFFVLYHTSALLVASCVALRATAIFLYWLALNLSGRTEVSRSVVEYWRTCRTEWDKVYEEEGEGRIGPISIVRGLAELAILQSMTYERWLQEGPGSLVLLNGIEGDGAGLATPRFGPLRRKASQEPGRPSITQRMDSYRWSGTGAEDDGEGLVLTRSGDGILEGSIISREARSPTLQLSRRLSGKRRRSLVPPSPTPSIEQVLDESDEEPPPFRLDSQDFELEDGTSTPLEFPSSPPLQPISDPIKPLEEFVSLVKRHCRLCTASYGLHTMLPSPPTPLLTPSGQTLPHRLFAHLGGLNDHRNVLHVALQKRYDGVPASEEDEIEATYAPQFYVLRDDVRGEIVCVIRGTQSLADVRTDLDGSLVPLELPPLDGETPSHAAGYRIHSAILSAARHLLSSTSSSPLYANLSRILADHPRYALVFTGHSLGAALASTLALLIGSYDPVERQWYVDPSSSLGNGEAGRPLRAVCFAHPTTLNVPLAERCAVPKQALRPEHLDSSSSNRGIPLVVNVSLGADVICRMGVPQVREIRRTLGRLDRLRSGAATSEDGRDRSPRIISSWRQWRRVVGRLGEAQDAASHNAPGANDSNTEDLLALEQTREELESQAWRWRSEAEGWDRQRSGALPEEADIEVAIPAGHCFHLDALPPDVEARKRQELREERAAAGHDGVRAEDGMDGGDDEDEPLLGFYEVRDPTRFYAMPVLLADLLGAHMPKRYLEATQSL
ncbi:hypothetical protein JCM10908_006552 [Rhodotorula pacifica]|uniref:uncharacterized protein n=1 Tax=Rhodotorula pacifica TaxID=1495444 RepID=UPI003176D943